MPNSHFSNYVSPNIVIVPTVSFRGPPPKKRKPGAECQPATQDIPDKNTNSLSTTMLPMQNITNVDCRPATQAIPVVTNNNSPATTLPVNNLTHTTIFPIDISTDNVASEENVSSYVEVASRNSLEDSEQRVKKTLSWASNYLQSIGQSQPKVTKLTNSAHQKFLPKFEEGRQQNAIKNLFKPTFRDLDVTQSQRNSFQQSSHTDSEITSANTDNSNSDSKHPIKINLLYHKRYTDSYSDKANTQNTAHNSHTPNCAKPVTKTKTDSMSTHSHSKPHNKNDTNNEKCDRDTKPQYLKKSNTGKWTDNISTSTHSKSREKNYVDKEKYDKNINTNSISTSGKNITVKRYADISKDRNKDIKDRKLPVKSKYVDIRKSSSKSEYKTKDRLETWASDRIKNHPKKPIHSHGKDRLETWASNRIKTYSEKTVTSHSNKSPSIKSRRESKKEMIKLKSREPTLKEDKGKDHKTKSKSSTKPNDDNRSNNSKLSTKSNENTINKMSEIVQATPIKSVVQVTNNYDLDSPFIKKPENVTNNDDLRTKLKVPDSGHNIGDLRTKLKRKYQNSQTIKRDNLIITVQNDNNDKEDFIDKQPTAEEKLKSEKKTGKFKKIKLVINVICEKCSESSESDSEIKNNEEYPSANVDLSFLDDFNVDDIVESLNEQEDKANVKTSPLNTMDSKYNIIAEKLVGKNIVKNEDNKDIKCLNLQKGLHTESPQMETDSKHILNAKEGKENNNDENYRFSEITGHVIQTSNNIPIPIQNKMENTELGRNSSIIVPTENSNELITNPIKLDTNHNNNRNDIFHLDLTSDDTDVLSTQLNKTTYIKEQREEVFNSQNNTKVDELIDSKLHKETGIGNIKSERETQIKDKDVLIIDLTQTETNISHEIKTTSSYNDVVNIQSSKQAEGKQHKSKETNSIIDLTLSTDTTSEIKKDVSSVPLVSEPQQPKIENTSTKNSIEAQSRDKISKMKNDTKDIQITEILSLPQHNKAKETVMKSNIIDLTSIKEKTSGIKNEDKKRSEIIIQMPKEHAAEEHLANNNILAQSTEITPKLKNNATSAENNINNARSTQQLQQYKANETQSNKAEIKNDTKQTAVKNDIINVQTTQVGLKPQQNEINDTLINNTNMKNTIKKTKTEIAARSQQHKIDETSSNNAEMENIIQNNVINAQLSETAPGPHQNNLETSSNNAEIKNNSTESTVLKPFLNVKRSEIAPESDQFEENKTLSNNNIDPQTAINNTKKADNSNSNSYKQEQNNKTSKTINETNINDDGQDVLSINISLEENLTSYNSEISNSDKMLINSPSCSKSVMFDTKETTSSKTEIINSTPKSKVAEMKKDDKPHIDNCKDNMDSAVTAKLKWKKTEHLLALEKRMIGYFGTNYNIESLIRCGKFSKLYLCKDRNGRNYALKVLNKGKRVAGCRIEDMLKDLQKDIPRKNYHCVFLIDGFSMWGQWCFLMDYYPKNMQQVLYENGKCLHVDTVQVLARQLVSAVLILRNNNIMHLDIKPAHILMNTTNDRLKLAGFDESQYLNGLSVLPCVGTVNYRPPEVILGFPYFGKIDVWSTALVIYEMCTNRQLFPGYYNNDILYKQMCTLGNIPFEMVIQSVFANKHYRGAYFARRYGPGGQLFNLIDEFNKSMRLATSLFEAYHRDWGKVRTKRQKKDDSAKLRVLRDLLQEMLNLDPTHRTPIEFVYANSFLYETFESCI